MEERRAGDKRTGCRDRRWRCTRESLWLCPPLRPGSVPHRYSGCEDEGRLDGVGSRSGHQDFQSTLDPLDRSILAKHSDHLDEIG